MNSQQQQQQQGISGAHPATVDDINRNNNMTQSSHPLSGSHPVTTTNNNNMTQQTSHHHPVEGAPHNNTSLWMKKPNTNASAVSSTPSEYGSDDSNSSSTRPVADKNAFMHPDEPNKHWQNQMSPAERAKQLAAEMDHTIEQRRKSSSSSNSNDKTLKIAGKKEINLN